MTADKTMRIQQAIAEVKQVKKEFNKKKNFLKKQETERLLSTYSKYKVSANTIIGIMEGRRSI